MGAIKLLANFIPKLRFIPPNLQYQENGYCHVPHNYLFILLILGMKNNISAKFASCNTVLWIGHKCILEEKIWVCIVILYNVLVSYRKHCNSGRIRIPDLFLRIQIRHWQNNNTEKQKIIPEIGSGWGTLTIVPDLYLTCFSSPKTFLCHNVAEKNRAFFFSQLWMSRKSG